MDHKINRVILAGLIAGARIATKKGLPERAASAGRLMIWSGVSAVPVSVAEASLLTLGRNDEGERRVVNAAVLLLQMEILTEDPGLLRSQTPGRSIDRWRRLYEAAVRGFFSAVLRDPWFGEQKQAKHRWPLDDATQRMKTLMPTMETDTVLRGPGRRILIETKFTDPTATHGQYGGIKFHRNHLFQLQTYLTTLTPIPGEVIEGVLLYPQIDESIDESAVVGEHRIRVMTVDLAAQPRQIRERLLAITDPPPA